MYVHWREDPPIVFSLAEEHLAVEFSSGRENHSIAFSVGGKMLTAASLHCICSRKEDAPFCRMREISPLYLLQEGRCPLLHVLLDGRGMERLPIAFCVGGENLSIILFLQGMDLDRCIFVRSGGFPN